MLEREHRKMGSFRGGFRCVVMAGGRSSRFASTGHHKSMAKVRGMPVISHVIDYWRQFTDDFVFVVKNGREPLQEFIASLPIRAEFVEPPALRGIADGLSYARPLINGPFVVVLGDCFCRGNFQIPDDLEYGILVQTAASPDSIRRNYAVDVAGGIVTAVEEKPVSVHNDHCGMGFYFFQPDLFEYIAATTPSPRTSELEITDVLQTIIDSGRKLHALFFDGTYINVNTPDDLEAVAAAIEARPD